MPGEHVMELRVSLNYQDLYIQCICINIDLYIQCICINIDLYIQCICINESLHNMFIYNLYYIQCICINESLYNIICLYTIFICVPCMYAGQLELPSPVHTIYMHVTELNLWIFFNIYASIQQYPTRFYY